MDPQAITQGSIEAFRRNVTEHYFDFEGRVGRSEFWLYVLAVVVIQIAVAIVDGILGTRILRGLLSLALFLPNLGMGARRLHDTNNTAWMLLLPAIPAIIGLILMVTIILWFLAIIAWLVTAVCAIYLIYLYAQPGTSGPNQYGPEPSKPITPSAKPAT
jgi:uncharacterized membrane protein YhaH (DUF805 family)